ncbi:MAG TPA: NADH-quinone oxidoreductase subunit NuoE [Actinoplanes sp.]|nr:NADH-quinone oxidoreductase subunit NuoE [Actinoplanes sp.]
MTLTDQTRLLAKEIVARYPRPRSALLPMLHLVQSEDGYVSPEGVRFCAEELGLTKAEVGAVATFYTMYKRRPAGDYLVSVCTNTLCDVLGGAEIYQALSEHLGVGHDETTADGRVTLEHAECLAACDYAPVVTVNYEFFDQQSPGSALRLVEELQAGRQPMPTRGAPLCTFKEISRQLAGFVDDRPGAVDAGPAGEPTLVGNRLAVQRGETAPAYGEPAPLDGDKRSAPAAPAAASTPVAPAAEERSPAPEPGERAGGPATGPTTEAERSAAGGTARYGGPPGEPSSGGGEGAAGGLDTSASDPASSPGSGVTHESDAAKADSPDPPASVPGRPQPTNRGRRTPRKEG